MFLCVSNSHAPTVSSLRKNMRQLCHVKEGFLYNMCHVHFGEACHKWLLHYVLFINVCSIIKLWEEVSWLFIVTIDSNKHSLYWWMKIMYVMNNEFLLKIQFLLAVSLLLLSQTANNISHWRQTAVLWQKIYACLTVMFFFFHNGHYS